MNYQKMDFISVYKVYGLRLLFILARVWEYKDTPLRDLRWLGSFYLLFSKFSCDDFLILTCDFLIFIVFHIHFYQILILTDFIDNNKFLLNMISL